MEHPAFQKFSQSSDLFKAYVSSWKFVAIQAQHWYWYV